MITRIFCRSFEDQRTRISASIGPRSRISKENRTEIPAKEHWSNKEIVNNNRSSQKMMYNEKIYQASDRDGILLERPKRGQLGRLSGSDLLNLMVR